MKETAFLKAIEAEPANPVPRLVYADWLDEQGDPRGELLRIQEELRRIDVPHRATKETQMHELLNEGVEPLLITHPTSIGMEMVLIFPGEFVMGSPKSEEDRGENEDQVEVRLTPSFWLGKNTVTQAEWQQVMGTRPWEGKGDVLDACGVAAPHPDGPATFVRWEDAMNFCRKFAERERQSGRLSAAWEYTLPSEAEWEYACRAGTTTAYSFGDEDSQLGEYAWFADNSEDIGEDYAHAVGTKVPNPWGLSDPHGNVWEWCRDCYADKLPGGRNPEVTAKGSGRVYRGGSWLSSSGRCRSAFRRRDSLSCRDFLLGFRVARVLSRK